MARSIIVLIDGTGCTATGGLSRHFSNVFRLGLAADLDANQAVFLYFSGPASRRVFGRFFGTITGAEINDILLEAYLSICNNIIDPELDKIYIFGFSRGAATAKALVSMLDSVGILRKKNIDVLKHAYKAYAFSDQTSRVHILGKSFYKDIEFVGLFDPVLGPRSWFIRVKIDEELARSVNYAVEIFAIDERRWTFTPSVWRELPAESPFDGISTIPVDPPEVPRLQHIWLSGCHSDIGNPEGNKVVSDIAFLTMIDCLQAKTALSLDMLYIQKVFDDAVASTRQISIRQEYGMVMFNRSIKQQKYTEIHQFFDWIFEKKIRINRINKKYNCARLIKNGRRVPIRRFTFKLDGILTRNGLTPETKIKDAIEHSLGQIE